MDDHIQELLDDYRRPYMSNAGDLEEDEFKTAEYKSHTAQHIFETAFGNTEMFFHSTSEDRPELDLETMKDESDGAYDRILQQLQQLRLTLQWPEEMVNGLWEEKADTVDEVKELLKPFSELGLWVFVRITR